MSRVRAWVFTTVLVMLSQSAPFGLAQPPPHFDLDVLSIERTPKYPGYKPNYDVPGMKGLPILTDAKTGRPMTEAQLRAVQRAPKAGQIVTFTAVVGNKGDAQAPMFGYDWLVDGKVAKAGRTKKPIEPGQTLSESFQWKWQLGRHRVEFRVSAYDRFLHNNQRADVTDAWSLLWAVDRKLYERFNQQTNMLGTRSFEDWAQWHIDEMNRLFDLSPLPTGMADSGWRPRVRCDRIQIVDGGENWEAKLIGEGRGALDAGYDGAWFFGNREDVAAWAAQPDWGLIHEWGHQLGLTDEYALDRPASQNEVLDREDRPMLTGHRSDLEGYMMHGHGPVPFSPLSMAALVAQKGVRRGFYGDYFFCTPRQVGLRLFDLEGRPVANAKIEAWQDRDNQYSGKPTFTVTTGGDGVAVLPNRPVKPCSTPPGFTLQPNPFGQIGVVGPGNVLLLRISARGHEEIDWLEVSELNLAWFGGQRDRATLTRNTRIPAIGALSAPRNARVELRGNLNTLVWQPTPGAVRYRIYGVGSKGRLALKQGVSMQPSFALPGSNGVMPRYVVTAEGSEKHSESGFSNEVRLIQMRAPWGIALGNHGRILVRDAAHPQFLVHDRTGNEIGLMGSVHDHLEGSFDLANGPDGNIYCAKWGDGYDPKQGYKVFNPDLTLVKSVLLPTGSGPGQVARPMGIGVDSRGHVFLADTGNDRVQEFDPSGKFVQSIGVGEMRVPMKVTFDKADRMFVADSGKNRVSIYERQSDGTYELTKELKDSKWIKEPCSVLVDSRNRVFVSTNRVANIYMFDAEGNLAWTYPQPANADIHGPRGLAMGQDGMLVVVDDAARRIWRIKPPE